MEMFRRDRDPARTLRFEHFEVRIVKSVESTLAHVSTELTYEDDLDATLAWIHDDLQLTGGGQTVVVIDTGIAYDHEALGQGFGADARVVGGWDFTDEWDANPYDDGPAGFHGTHVAGIIGSDDDQRPGLAPEVDLVALRVFDDQGRSDFDWIEQALQWVHDHQNDFEHPITTVNLSIGVSASATVADRHKVLDDEFAQLKEDGVFVAVAAGNEYDRTPVEGLSYPASSEHVVAVGSVGNEGELSRFSRRGTGMLAAPGEHVMSTATDYLFDFNGKSDDWMSFSGTSQATPYVSGAAILIRQAYARVGTHSVDQDEIYNVMVRTADWITDEDTGESYARLNLRRAVDDVLGELLEAEGGGGAGEAHAELDSLHASTNLGSIAYTHMPQVSLTDGVASWQFRASTSGVASIDARFDTSDVTLQLYDAQGSLLDQGVSQGGHSRVDWQVRAGDELTVRVVGKQADGQVTIANLVETLPGNRWHVDVVDSVTNVSVDASQELAFALDGLEYRLPAASHLSMAVGPSHKVSVGVTSPDREVHVRPGLTEIRGTDQHVSLRGADRVSLQGTRETRLTMVGTEANDHVTAGAAFHRLAGPGYDLAAEGFGQVKMIGGGGEDYAFLAGSSGDDRVTVNEHAARWTYNEGTTTLSDFGHVVANGGSGGFDQAQLLGTAGDDALSVNSSAVRLAAAGQVWCLESFDQVEVTAGEGGVDRAYFHGTDGVADTFRADPAKASLRNSSSDHSAVGFDRVYAYSQFGDGDVATLIGSNGQDTFLAEVEGGALGGDGFHNGTYGFDTVHADGGGGTDRMIAYAGSSASAVTLAKHAFTFETGVALYSLQNFESLRAWGNSSVLTIAAAVLSSWASDHGTWGTFVSTAPAYRWKMVSPTAAVAALR